MEYIVIQYRYGRDALERKERDRLAIEKMHAARDWTWTAPNASSHL